MPYTASHFAASRSQIVLASHWQLMTSWVHDLLKWLELGAMAMYKDISTNQHVAASKSSQALEAKHATHPCGV